MSFKSTIGGFVRDLKTRIYKSQVLAKHPRLRSAFNITSHLTYEERYTLFKLAEGKKHILEIGSYIGCSAACFGAQLINEGGRIFCIDTWQNDAMTEGGRDTSVEFHNNTKEFRTLITPVRGFSTEVVDEVRKLTPVLDVLFIDGDHSYEGAKGDWEAYKGFLSSGSIVICHDIGWAEGVKRVVEEDIKPHVNSFDHLPNLWWGVIR
jgi:predicted O-methyltransferase YrrM